MGVPFYTHHYRYDTNGIVSDSMRTDRDNYRPFFGTEENSRLQSVSSVEETLNFTRPPDFQGFYMAIRDPGTCGNIGRIIVYYRVAPGFSQTQIDCPDVPLPIIGSGATSSVSCTCLGNTSALDGSSLERSCDQNGVCTEGQSCGCDAGLQFNSDLNTCVGKGNSELTCSKNISSLKIRDTLSGLSDMCFSREYINSLQSKECPR